MTAANPFAALPANAVAVRSDGVYMTVHQIGTVKGLGNPQFFNANGTSRGEADVSGVADQNGTCSFFMINNETNPRVNSISYLVVWYLTKYAQSARFEVRSISSTVLAGQLKKLGMEWENVINATTMFGVSRSVKDQAAAQCRTHGWTLRGD